MAMSTAARVSSRVHQLPEQSFVRVRDLEVRIGATRHAIEVALSRLAATETLHSVGRGLYWKGSRTREGMEPPPPLQLGIELGGVGSGPAELSAVRFLGLTSQVPVAVHVAVPGRARAAMPGITFHARPYSRVLHALRPAEVAVLEVLRMWPSGIESDWSALRRRVIALIKQDVVRVPIVTAALRDERTPNARRHWQRLSERFTTSR
jgi:predicted transcriptional regulator of viral defense system